MSSSALPRSYPGLRRLPLSAGELELEPPPAELLPDTFAGRLYGMLAPLAQKDPVAGWSLLILVNAIGLEYQLVEDWVRDSPDGPGWSLLMDLDRCPPEALPWLGQFVGVRVPTGLNDAQARAWVASTDGFRRGTPAAMRGAAQATLTGDKLVVFTERFNGDAYALDVATYVDQTPDPALTERALIAQKPGGIVMTYRASPGQDYGIVDATNVDYAAVHAKYPSYQALLVDQPGT
jgi:hypothetical protein